MIDPLHYHRCHGRSCEGKHKATTFTSESEERRKGWARCHCPIVAGGTLNRISRRMATKQTDWKKAAEVMAPYVAANSWSPTLPPSPPPGLQSAPEPASSPERRRLADAIEVYIKAHEDASSATMTVIGHRSRLSHFLRYAESIGRIFLDQWDDEENYGNELVKAYLGHCGEHSRVEKLEPTTRQRYLGVIKSFFNYCLKVKRWVKNNPAKFPPEIKNRAHARLRSGKQRYAFSNADLARMYDACLEFDNYVVRRDGSVVRRVGAARSRDWTGQDVSDFMAVLTFTGLRISLVAQFHISRLQPNNEVHIRDTDTKNGKAVYSKFPDWLAERVRARAAKFGPYIFGEHTSVRNDVITNGWRARLNALWEICGDWEMHPVPHRFRHTFVRVLLEDGKSYADVADLLGDTEAVVRRHYAGWAPERQARLSRVMEQAFRNVPIPVMLPEKGKVLGIRKLG